MTSVVLRTVLLANALLWSVICLAADAKDVQRALGGAWVGDGLSVVINADTLQANTEPERPFQWDTFRLLNVTGSFVVFEIGHQRFVGKLEADGSLALTAAGSSRQYALRHPTPLVR